MENRRSIILILVVSLFLGVAIMHPSVDLRSLSADSGWDSDWDSGSDWDSDWGGSSWDYDSDWGSSSSGDYGDADPAALLIFIVVVIIIIVFMIKIDEIKKKQPNMRKIEILHENQDAIAKMYQLIPNFNKDEFYDEIFKNFVDVQEAWMNFDYDKLRTLVTDELFNTYRSQLNALELKKQKNVMHHFDRQDIVITNFTRTGDKDTINLKMVARFFDYLVDKDEKTIRGNDRRRIIITYALTYVSSVSKGPNKCPNCGAPLDNDASSNVCPYCNSTVISKSHTYLLSKKESIEQRSE